MSDRFDCPHHGSVRVDDVDSMPSMLGHGTDESLTLSCHCTVTFDPFKGEPFVRPETDRQRVARRQRFVDSLRGRPPVVVDSVATNRAETEPCERGTVGCSVEHRSDSECQPW